MFVIIAISVRKKSREGWRGNFTLLVEPVCAILKKAESAVVYTPALSDPPDSYELVSLKQEIQLMAIIAPKHNVSWTTLVQCVMCGFQSGILIAKNFGAANTVGGRTRVFSN